MSTLSAQARACTSAIRPLRFKPGSENELCNQIALWLKSQVEDKEKPILFFHIPNEQYDRNQNRFTHVLLLLGLIPGAPDYFISFKKKCLFLEVKSKGGHLSPNQRNFLSWAGYCQIPYHVIHDLQEFLKLMQATFRLS
jgi:hypothetical protein